VSLFQVNKPKSAAKIMLPTGSDLSSLVKGTLEHIANMVGVTLGPSGRQVIIERPEIGMRPFMTKDGVTVIKNMGYDSAARQLILESVRDAAMRTASEAGDGTTTATILAWSICRDTDDAVKRHAKLSPQRIVREMQALVPKMIQKLETYRVDNKVADTHQLLLRVASVSANDDQELARSVMEALDTVGDDGNITIIELPGQSKYEVERIAGYTVDSGYEESCVNFANGFLNDKTGTMVILNRPLVILFDGVINDIGQILEPMTRIGQYFMDHQAGDQNVVLVAHGFSNSVVGDLHLNWNKGNFKVYPMVTSKNAISNSATELLYDLQAYAGTPVFNPIDRPLVDMNIDFMYKNNRVRRIEAAKFRTSVIVDEDQKLVSLRVGELKERLKKPDSTYDQRDLEVRIGKLTSGIARLNIYGPSQAETREKRDRAEDAWMAIRGTIKYGALPGGGHSLVRLAADMDSVSRHSSSEAQSVAADILSKALLEPVRVLYRNYGHTEQETVLQIGKLLQSDQTFNIATQSWVPTVELLDSFPAVSEAIRNSVSIASLMGTVGGLIAFQRDPASDKSEEQFVRRFERGANIRSVE
jgi:chaperonin GroEL